MKLEILNTKAVTLTRSGQNCRIGKSGAINFSPLLAEQFSLTAGNRYLLAVDKSEKQVKKLYLIPTEKKYGTKMFLTKNHLRLNFNTMLTSYKLNFPINCDLSFAEKSNDTPIGTLCLSFLA
jgi:hypothetical protein